MFHRPLPPHIPRPTGFFVGRTFAISTLISLFFMVGRPAHAGSPKACSIEPASYAGIQLRSKVIRWPNGRSLTIIGHNHGRRDTQDGTATTLGQIVKAGRLWMPGSRTVDTMSDRLLGMVSEDPTAAVDAHTDLIFLREYLRKSPQVGFVAVEASPATVAMNLKSYGQVHKELLRELARRRLKVSTVDEDVQALAFGADFFVRLNDPLLFAHRTLIGAEDEALGRAYLDLLPKQAQATAALSRATFDPDVAARMNQFLNTLPARYPTFKPETDESAILTEARKKFSASALAKTEPYLLVQLSVMRAMKARDGHDVEALLAQKTSGVMFIGSAHMDSIAELLRERCVRGR